MRKLSEEIRAKSKAQKAVGHTNAAVVTHELLENWALKTDELNQTIKDLTKGLQTIVDSSWFDERSPETKIWITALIEKANDY